MQEKQGAPTQRKGVKQLRIFSFEMPPLTVGLEGIQSRAWPVWDAFLLREQHRAWAIPPAAI